MNHYTLHWFTILWVVNRIGVVNSLQSSKALWNRTPYQKQYGRVLWAVSRTLLGGNFGPEKKYLSPPPPPRNSPQAPSRPLALPLLGDPPPGIFNKKPTSPPSWRLGLPLPLLQAEKKKNIRNVHQDSLSPRRGGNGSPGLSATLPRPTGKAADRAPTARCGLRHCGCRDVSSVKQVPNQVHHGIATAVAIAIFWIAGEIARNFRSKKQIWPIFHRKMHRNRNRIITAEKSQPKGPFRTVFSTESDSVVFYYSVLNLLHIVIHYLKYSKSIQSVAIHYIFNSESLRVVNSLQMVNSLRILFLVCRGPLGTYFPERTAAYSLAA